MPYVNFWGWKSGGLLALLALGGVDAAAAQVKSATIPTEVSANVPSDPMTLIPANQRHAFAAVDPTWTKATSWLEPGNGGYTMHPDGPHKPEWLREERYFDTTDTTHLDAYRKLMRYSADGKFAGEADRQGDAYWWHAFWPDGSLASYDFRSRPMHMDAGISVRRDGKAVSSFTGGRGTLLQWHTNDARCEQLVIRDGICLLGAMYETRCVALQLRVENDELLRDPAGESLMLASRAESWTLEGSAISGVPTHWEGDDSPKVLPADDIHKRFMLNTRSGPNWGHEGAAVALTRQDYDARRTEFVTAYTAFLKSHGETWESLHVERLRDDPTAELPVPDPAWNGPARTK